MIVPWGERIMQQIEQGRLLWVEDGEAVWSANAAEQIDEEVTQIVTEVAEQMVPTGGKKRARRRDQRR